MFGFLPAPCGTCHSAEHSTYRAYFCGLSSTLAREYGPAARFFTNRDGTFFSILAAAWSEAPPTSSTTTCCNPLGRPRLLYDQSPHASYAAAVSVCGVHTKLADDAEDEAGLRRLVSSLGSRSLHSWVNRASTMLDQFGFPTEKTAASLKSQRDYELAATDDWRHAAIPSQQAYGNIFEHTSRLDTASHEISAQTSGLLQSLGSHIGRLIYLADAYEDKAEDKAKGRFNPLCDSPKQKVIDSFEEEFQQIRDGMEQLQPVRHESLLRSILVDQLYQKCALTFDLSVAGRKSKTRLVGKERKKKHWWDDCCDTCYCCDCSSGCCNVDC